MLEDGCDDDCELELSAAAFRMGKKKITSSHSAPAVSRATNVSDIPNRRATIAVLSMKTSAPNSRRKSPAMKAELLKAMLSQSIADRCSLWLVLGVMEAWFLVVLGNDEVC
jgi:hypothetical protein